MTSAYPKRLDALTDQVRALAVELGEWPSRNQVMKRCKVGAPKATTALAALRASGFTPADHAVTEATRTHAPALDQPAPEVAPVRRLHSVPVESDQPAPEAAEPAAVEPVPVAGNTVPMAVTGEGPAGDSTPPVVEVEPVAPAPTTTPTTAPTPVRRGARPRPWPLLLIAAGAFVAIWGGWVGLGEMTGFGPIRLLPGIADDFVVNSAITLPLGVEAYAAYALRVWLSGATRSARARSFAQWSAIGALVLGALGQVAYHLMEAYGVKVAPWWITTFVSCLPVVVLGCGAALNHLLRDQDDAEVTR
ncbi:ABC transporter permease [Saccharothrix coeruleofusca]|uniref:ABC transporter permease n=1 Tax=Saccharothrix coeruleofusca TaxID=33919 RepID=A0A918AGY9_9PSEU|nr:ABC transporter permease [Saccharothrix coeruleofusca]GGP35982.1 ABC transporter permease [Saccharothrix coeruleofusca]